MAAWHDNFLVVRGLIDYSPECTTVIISIVLIISPGQRFNPLETGVICAIAIQSFVRGNISSSFTRRSEDMFPLYYMYSDPEDHEEMFPLYYMYSDVSCMVGRSGHKAQKSTENRLKYA